MYGVDRFCSALALRTATQARTCRALTRHFFPLTGHNRDTNRQEMAESLAFLLELYALLWRKINPGH